MNPKSVWGQSYFHWHRGFLPCVCVYMCPPDYKLCSLFLLTTLMMEPLQRFNTVSKNTHSGNRREVFNNISVPLARITPLQIHISLAFPLLSISVMFRFPQVTCRSWGYFFPFLNSTWLLSGFFYFTLNRLGLVIAMDEMLHWMHPWSQCFDALHHIGRV